MIIFKYDFADPHYTRKSLKAPILVGIFLIVFIIFSSGKIEYAEAQTMSCPQNIGDFYLTSSEVYEWGEGTCEYQRDEPYGILFLRLTMATTDSHPQVPPDDEYWCTGHKESGAVWSSTHYAKLWIDEYTAADIPYDLFDNAMPAILSDIESQNIAVGCDYYGPSNGDACPPDYPYLWSDGLCYDQPEPVSPTHPKPESCPPDYPYLWSDGLCYDQPEGCPPDYPYLWSDDLCYDEPESNYLSNGCHVDYPYLWSDGECYDQPESEQSEYDSWIKQGKENLEAGNFDEAIKYFDLAYKQNPNDQNLINLKAEALMEKGVALKHEGKYDLAVIYLGESNHLRKSENVLAIQNDAYKRWYNSIQPKTLFDPNVQDNWKLLDPIDYVTLPVVGKISGDSNNPSLILSPNGPKDLGGGTPLQIGDIILTGQNSVKLDWGGAETVVAPLSAIMVGDPEDLRKYGEGNPHYIEIIEGHIKLWEKGKDIPKNTKFLFKVSNQPIEISGTDVIISRDKTTETSVVHIHEGTVKVFDDASKEIKEFGAGNTLVVKDVGVTQTKTLSDQTWDSLVSEIELEPTPTQPLAETTPLQTEGNGGCLIATATFGSELAPQVQFLREIRDNTVLSTASGTSFMTTFNSFYYSFSPTVADWERQNPAFKELVKVAVTPLLSSLILLQYVDIDSEAEILGYGIGIILLNIGMYFVAPIIMILKIKPKISKRFA